MKLIHNNDVTDPRINLALEEYALTSLDPTHDYLLFYVNEPSVIIGKHQNTHEEINSHYVEFNQIHVVRRMSGGGAVYHDLGNLNFSFISQADKHIFHRYETFTAPIVDALHALGVPAELNGRNDLVVNGRKISGNAQYQRGTRMFCHGTLLFNSNLDHVVSALNIKLDKIESKGIKSIRSRVANISEFLSCPLTLQEFKAYLLSHIFNEQKEVHHFSESDWLAVHKLSQEKYHLWDWNYGNSPPCNIQNRKRFSVGEIDVRLFVEKSILRSIRFYGDFFSQREIGELEQALTNCKYEKQALREVLDKINLHHFFGSIGTSEFLELLI